MYRDVYAVVKFSGKMFFPMEKGERLSEDNAKRIIEMVLRENAGAEGARISAIDITHIEKAIE